MNLQEWINSRLKEDLKNMVYGQASINQAVWVRDHLYYMIVRALDVQGLRDQTIEERRDLIQVCNTHISKRVELPVYHFNFDGVDLKIRGNFHDWCIKYTGPDVTLPTWMANQMFECKGFYEGMENYSSHITFCVRDRETMFSVLWWMLNEVKQNETHDN